MSSKTIEFYEFADFRLDLSQKVLLRDGKPVPLTPKAFDTLEILLENGGRLLEKDDLMKKLWPDRFVEESNLTSNIKTLRRVLGDDAAHPRFIETVPRRGYRFIADVKESSRHSSGRNGAAPEYSGHNLKIQVDTSVFRRFLLPAIVILTVGFGGTGFWYALRKYTASMAPILTTDFGSEKLSTDGKVPVAAISPDGKMVVYVSAPPGEKQSVWLRQLESGNNVQVISPTDEVYRSLAFSPDANSLYFSRGPNVIGASAQLYRVSIFGGIPTKIIDNLRGSFSISPSAKNISFVRCIYGGECSLWLADAENGKNERKLASRQRSIRIADNQFSPDGRSIVFAVGQSENAANEFGLVEIDVETASEREFTKERFFNINHLAWLPDQSGLLITASRIPNDNFRIWHVSATTGEVTVLTKDSESYSILSLDKAASNLVSTQVRLDFHIRLFNPENPQVQPRVLTDGTHLSSAPNGKIVFASSMSGNYEIWGMNVDGSGKQQLTNNVADDRMPVFSSDGNRIFFSSNRSGEAHVWRMNTDGSDQVQVTQKEGGWPLFVSPDGQWIYYHHGIQRTLWRVSTAGGDEQLMLDKAKRRFAISPDGSEVAFSEKEGEKHFLVIASLANGQTVRTYKFADQTGSLVELKWVPDGKGIAYILANNRWENNILWLQTFNADQAQKIADLGDEEVPSSGFAMLTDGSFVVAQGGWKHDSLLFKGLK
jgi:Tol biopolymer transport system component/DNA-binding winged helix-turn-helix (wHTH) protein